MVNNRVRPQDIINGVNAGMCLLDKNFRVVWINKCQSDWMGSYEEVCGRHCYKAFERRNHICRGCPTLKVFKTGRTHTAKRRAFTKEGKKRYYQVTVSPIKDGKGDIEFALELTQDITEKALSERRNLKIINKLKHMYKHISSVNKKLRNNVYRLNKIATHVSKFKSVINKKYYQKMQESTFLKKELHDIFKVNHVLSSTIDIEKIASLITHLSCELMHADACTLRLLDDRKKSLIIAAASGIVNGFRKKIHVLDVGEGISGRAVEAGKPVASLDITKDKTKDRFKDIFKKEGFKSAVAIPILFQNRILGVIAVFSKTTQRFSREDIKMLGIFASQVAIAIQESKHYEDIHKNYFDTVHALVLAEEARDPYTRGHTERVTRYALSVGKNMRLTVSELEILRYAGEVHDIGKIGIPDFILGKPGRLTPAERAMVELHPVKGAEMLEPLEFLRPVLPIVRHHHERYDGTGYPDGLVKEKIPLMARILACADSFDAMTSDRPYRNRKLTVDEALAEIKNNSGSQFDPQIARSFIQLIRSKYK